MTNQADDEPEMDADSEADQRRRHARDEGDHELASDEAAQDAVHVRLPQVGAITQVGRQHPIELFPHLGPEDEEVEGDQQDDNGLGQSLAPRLMSGSASTSAFLMSSWTLCGG